MTNTLEDTHVKRILVKSHARLTSSGKLCWVHSYYRNIHTVKDKPQLTSLQTSILKYRKQN